jgi:ketosteroid isomerase-like protein
VIAAKPATEVAVVTPPAKPAVTKPEPVKPAAAKPEPAKPAATSGDQDDILNAVTGWASAWSDKNTNAYLAFYASSFETPKGMSFKAWADSRRVRIEGKGRISVKIDSPKVSIDGNTATVKFRQIYNSDQLKADSRKTLVFSKQGGKWQITQERTGG